VKDLTPGPGSENYEDQDGSPHLSSLTNIYGRLFFLAVANGSLALWVSDGSDEGTMRLTYGNVDFTWIMPYFIEYNGQAYFVAYEGSIPFGDGMGLFKSDGTVEGTQLVKADVGESLINSAQLTTMGNKIYLFGYSNLWKSDGTPEGTVVVKEFRTPRGSFPQWLTDLSGTLFFTTANEAFAFRATDGTTENTRMLNEIAYARGLRNVNGKLFFSGIKSTEPESSLHMELYASDGTDEGTVLIKDIEPDGNSDPSGFTAFPGGVMFAAQTSVAGRELWKTDGTTSGTVQVSDINPASGSSTPDALTGVSGKVFFKAHNGSVGEELWISRGLGRNTHLVKDIYPGAPSSQLSNLIAFKGNLYFIANDGAHGFELWRSNGKSSGSRMVKDMRTGDAETGMDFGNIIKSDQAMYYSGLLHSGKSALIKSTGTSYGTKVLKQFESNVPGSMVGSIGHDAFVMIRFPGYSELWQTTGKASGTTKLITMDGEEAHRPDDHAVLNGILYFSSRSSDGSHKLWRTDGTIPGTYYFNLEGAPMYLTVSGQRVFFSGEFYETGRELYVVEEASAATVLAKASSISGNSDSRVDNEAVVRYPNPFISSLTLRVNGNGDEYFNLNVIQTDGKIQDRRFGLPCNITHTMGANWPAGMYILQIEMRGRIMTTKVIKTR
jgi:ELWxxDGT repeat protein